jgi:hypothetical protein
VYGFGVAPKRTFIVSSETIANELTEKVAIARRYRQITRAACATRIDPNDALRRFCKKFFAAVLFPSIFRVHRTGA